jgi:competence protein CoiA
MLCAQNQGGDVLASQVTKEDGPFTCPMCNKGVLVKKGRVKIHHFAHIPPSSCAYGIGESETHRQAKLDIYEALLRHPEVTNLKLEHPLGDVRPDISFSLRNTPVAVEVQVSTLDLDTIDRRTKSYANKGISLLWVSPYQGTLQAGKQYSPTLWEKYLHALYFGRLYYWLEGETLLPVRFDDFKIHVQETSWYDSDGNACYAGGYDRYSKRYINQS